MLFPKKKHSANHAVVELPKEALRDSLTAAQITFKRYANPDVSGAERPGYAKTGSATTAKSGSSVPRMRYPEPRSLYRQYSRETPSSHPEPVSVPTTPLGANYHDMKGKQSNSPSSVVAAETAAYLAHSNSFSNRPSPVGSRDSVIDAETRPPRAPSALKNELQVNKARIPPPSYDNLLRSRSISPQVSYSTSLSSSCSISSGEEDTSYIDRGSDGAFYPEPSVSSYSLASKVSNKSSQVEALQGQQKSDYAAMNKLNGGNVVYKGTLPDLIPRSQRKVSKPRFKHKLLRSSDTSEYNNGQQQENLSRIYSNQQQNGRAIINTQQNVKLKTTMRRGKYAITENDETFPYEGRSSVSSDSDTDEDFDAVEIKDKKKKSRRSKLKKGLKTTAAVVGSSTSVLPFPHHHHHHNHNQHQLHNPNSHHLHAHHYTSPRMFNEDKPWKSHRDVGFITEQERKRYESMWVSNRYSYLRLLPWWPTLSNEDDEPNVQPLDLPQDGLMLNLVVKDIWYRSNLPTDLLVQIYNLVDTRKDGTLDRKSFIVGMWLVDQCLYGRKLTNELDQRVWNSADNYVLGTINVKPSATDRHHNADNALEKPSKLSVRQELKNIKHDLRNVRI
ncbi:YJL083W [Saccharomyces arboricola H-6]|uniref:YJL083W n=1 Tax=Saccharomyces arboricola (strain H-6 / AS 2.3317 / CBS 10644) TaxID=1160507 RepID=J8Q0L3_SACAR|nr:YJL083W [Saccharomyces arboricola H-6]